MLSDILSERFQWASYWFLEGSEFRELTDEESAAVHRFEKLSETIAAIPLPLLEHAECLAQANDEKFNATFDQMISRVGRGYYPDTAEEFVRTLSGFLESA
ncbi:hypothetical protein ASC80_06375 [Afipia sp. Root123D2]|uniref:hypothetical protein n=1 Tax=Afipia sp. Root123D2 TaxID=1736436 RepID=UPI0006F3F9BB|nr:hypothetical protein [Afipia sp. Root123D2]KQW22949.1 hypothetical protein ASC80_06375 [Afipia sp. Root123D2]